MESHPKECPVLINGEFVDPQKAAVSVWDTTMQRGDGIFDIVSVERNEAGDIVLLGLDLHFVRLFRCAEQVMYKIEQSREQLEVWMRKVAELGGAGKIRVMFTRGGTGDSGGAENAPPLVIILWHPKSNFKVPGDLLPLEYPWSCDRSKELGGIKWMSYAPNMLMTRLAEKRGFEDALLTTHDGYVLEGPTFSVGWLKNGNIFLPSVKEMKLLPSITTAITMTLLHNLGFKITIGKYLLEELLSAEEVFACSATRILIPIERIGDRRFSIEQGMKMRESVMKGCKERENWIGHLTSPYDFPLGP